MRKPIEDEIHDIILRQLDAEMAATFGTTSNIVPLNMKDIEHMIEECEKLPKVPDLMHVFIARDGKTIQVERVIDLATATEEDAKNVFRNHPNLGIDLTGAQLVSFERPKFNWEAPMFSMGVWEPTPEENVKTEETNEVT